MFCELKCYASAEKERHWHTYDWTWMEVCSPHICGGRRRWLSCKQPACLYARQLRDGILPAAGLTDAAVWWTDGDSVEVVVSVSADIVVDASAKVELNGAIDKVPALWLRLSVVSPVEPVISDQCNMNGRSTSHVQLANAQDSSLEHSKLSSSLLLKQFIKLVPCSLGHYSLIFQWWTPDSVKEVSRLIFTS